jgi:SAM-dependent methyltransferase
MHPLDLATRESHEFIRTRLPGPSRRILEVGCGSGALAARLQADGHTVVALDASDEAVHKARQRGVDARRAEWPDFSDEAFDVVLFTRSLHHIHALDAAVERAAELLAPDGLIVLEEFDFEATTPAEIAWVYGVLNVLNSGGHLNLEADTMPKRLLLSGGDRHVWQHDHDLHSVAAMRGVLEKHFTVQTDTSALYLYRYILPLLTEDEAGYALAGPVFDMERRLVDAGALRPIGRWLVGAEKNK